MRHLLRFFYIALFFSLSLNAFAEIVADDGLPDLYNLVIKTSLEDLDYKTAVHYSIRNPHTSTSSRERAARGEGGDVLAKYDVLIDNVAYDPNQGAAPADMQQPGFIDFTVAENTIQGWARMSEAALPALNIVLNGETSGHASASWRTRYQVTGNGLRNVSLKFRIPETVIDGRFEFSGKGPHQGRVKVQVLVNGYPVWWSEAIRAAVKNPTTANQWEIHTFGKDWNFSATTEKAAAKWVTASLGSYSASTTLDVTVVYFVEASVDVKCKLANNMYACMGINAGFKRENISTFPSFTSGPPLLSTLPNIN